MARLRGSKSRPVVTLDDADLIVDLCSFADMNDQAGAFIAQGLTPDQVREEIRKHKNAAQGPVLLAAQQLNIQDAIKLLEKKIKTLDDPNYIAIQRANMEGEIEELQTKSRSIQRYQEAASKDPENAATYQKLSEEGE